MAGPELSILPDRPDKVFAGGHAITGSVEVMVVDGFEEADLTLSLVCRGSARDDRISRTVTREHGEIRLFEGPWPPGSYEYRFEITAPDGPPTYAGHIFDVTWSLQARAHIPGGDEVAVAEDVTLQAGPRSPPPDATPGSRETAPRPTGGSSVGCLSLAMPFTALGVLLLWLAWAAEPEAAEIYGLGGGVVTLLGLGALTLVARGALVGRRIGGASVRLGARQVTPGGRIPVTLAFVANSSFEITAVRAVVRSHEVLDFFKASHRKHLKQRVFESAHDLPLARKAVRKGASCEIRGEIRLPREAPCSLELMESGQGMALRWEIEFAIVMKGAPDWCHMEDIVVLPRATGESA